MRVVNAVADVVTPVSNDADELARVLDFIEAHESRRDGDEPGFVLSHAGDDECVELTAQLHEILKRIVSALSHGESISILTRDEEISTQQAAEILGLSRPTVVRLIKDGELRAHVPGTVRRRLLLADVLDYREELRARRNRFITESSAEFEDYSDDEVADALTAVRGK